MTKADRSPAPARYGPAPDTESKVARGALLAELGRLVGPSQVLTSARQVRGYTRGFRYGSGAVACVVRPGSLVEQWRVLNAAIAAGRIVIFQAANTGLTGGSTPWGDDYDREIVLVSLRRLKGVHLVDGGRQVVCLPGATLDALEKALRPLGREPHSVIGSSCIGASVLGGVCNNSGGALIHRGPAYTEMALYAEVREDGSVALVNHLGLPLGNDPEEILARVEKGDLPEPEPSEAWGSDREYAAHVRDVDAATPARFNADPRRLREASGCAGKLAVFAVRLDTFEAETTTRVFYVGTNDTAELTAIRRHMQTIMPLPSSAASRFSKCDRMSATTTSRRVEAPTSASIRPQRRAAAALSVSSASSVISSNSASIIPAISSAISTLATRAS